MLPWASWNTILETGRSGSLRNMSIGRPRVGHAEPCCIARALHDKRTPGLFKVEWEDDGFVGLCSKTYYCFGPTDTFSTKGLKTNFMEVLQNRSGVGKNCGFRVRDSSIYAYIHRLIFIQNLQYKPTESRPSSHV